MKCFSQLLALSGSAVGRAHLAQSTELLADLLALLHTGSERVQRQVSILDHINQYTYLLITSILNTHIYLLL